MCPGQGQVDTTLYESESMYTETDRQDSVGKPSQIKLRAAYTHPLFQINHHTTFYSTVQFIISYRIKYINNASRKRSTVTFSIEQLHLKIAHCKL